MYAAKMIADSVAKNQARLCTMQVTMPRIVLAEFNTHRDFSRNSASSRARPVADMIRQVRTAPFVPDQFLENKKGMQGGEALTGDEHARAKRLWLDQAEEACETAEAMAAMKVHKQYVNRLLEPFLWHTVIVSSTRWDNFYAQRCHPDAQPEIQQVARMMRDCMDGSRPAAVEHGWWHLPYVSAEELSDYGYMSCKMFSVARCARVSYDRPGEGDHGADRLLYERLRAGGHWSPYEHVATPTMSFDAKGGNFNGWLQLRQTMGQ